MEHCPDENSLSALVDGTLDEAGRESILQHLESCASCSAAVAALLAVETPAETTTEPPGDRACGRFRLDHCIGMGGIGSVYQAYDSTLERTVAVKTLRSDLAGNQAAADLLLREARTAGLIDHPGVIPIHELGWRDDGTPYYAMKLVRGRTLGDALAACTTLPERLLYLPHLHQLCQTVAYAHSLGVIHRDISASNVMVGPFGETFALDWGLARSGETDAAPASPAEVPLHSPERAISASGQPIGTLAYTSPEQAMGKLGDVDARSDVWCLGGLLYQILTGQPPHTGDDFDQVLAAAQRGQVTPVRALCPAAPRELVAICDRALQPEPAQRYQGAQQLAADLGAFLTGEKVAAFEYGLTDLLRRLGARNRRVLIAIAVSAALLVAVAAIGYARVVRERDLTRVAEQAAQQRSAETLIESAWLSLRTEAPAAALAKLRASLEIGDSLGGRAIWAELSRLPLAAVVPLDEEPIALDFVAAGTQVRVATAASQTLIDLDTLQEISRTPGHAALPAAPALDPPALSFALSGDGALLASGHRDSLIRLWDRATLKLLKTLPGHSARVSSLAFDRSGHKLLSASWDGTARLWSIPDGALVATFPHSRTPVYQALFSPDEQQIATAGSDRLIRLFDVATQQLRSTLAGHSETVVVLAWSPANNLLASASADRTLRLWHPDRSAQPAPAPHAGAVWSVAFTSDGQRLASAGRDGSVRLWNVASGALVEVLRGPGKGIDSVAISDDGAWIAAGCRDRSIWLWNLVDGASSELRGHTGTVQQVAFDRRTGRLVSMGSDGTVRQWDLARQREVEAPRISDQALATIGIRAAGATGERTRPDLPPPYVLAGHRGAVLALGHDRSGSRLASGGADGTVRLWDARSGQALWQSGDGHALDAAPLVDTSRLSERPAFGGHRLASVVEGAELIGFEDGTVGIWDLRTGRRLDSKRLHGAAIDVVSDGAQLLVRSELRDQAQFDVSTFRLPYCQLLQQVWRAAPATWRNGQLVREQPPARHRCR